MDKINNIRDPSARNNITPSGKQVLLFDGVCNLCNGFVQFILKRDIGEQFVFASLQSEIGQLLLQQHQLPNKLRTVVLIDNDKAYIQSDVPIKVAQSLGGWIGIVRIAWLFPKFIRDALYDLIAANRYRIFGKQEKCILPKPEWKGRFLDT